MLISLLLNDVGGVIQYEEFVAGDVTPGRNVDLGTFVIGDNLDTLASIHTGERTLQSDSQLTATDFAGSPTGMYVFFLIATHLNCPLESPLQG
jgi:hypothetical protein